jgi:DNA-binding LacI/PurR family transcriptional regulator
MAVTIQDVARHAGVSRSTVSYVLSGKRSISPETTDRVQRIIDALGFHPHAGARSVRAGRSGVIALSLPMVHGRRSAVQMPYVWATLTAAQDVGLKVLVLTDDDGETAVREAVGSAMVDGVIVMEVQRQDPRIRLLQELKCPTIVVGSPDNPRGLPRVDFDLAAAAWMAAEHLHQLGHSHVGYLGPVSAARGYDVAYAVHARDAVLSSLRELTNRSAPWTDCDSTPDGVRSSLDHLLTEDPDLTGLIVYNERALPLVLHHLVVRGRQVPQDMSVIAMGYDDEAESTVPPFTSVTLPADRIAQTAVVSLAHRIAGETVPAHVSLAPELRIRATTAQSRTHDGAPPSIASKP